MMDIRRGDTDGGNRGDIHIYKRQTYKKNYW